MANYAVGDIQGCLQPLKRILDIAEFNHDKDTLWVAGDLVNRGPESLETLRFIKSLPSTRVVLGNHDLHLLAVAAGRRSMNKKDTLEPILAAADREELIDWLRCKSLIHHDSDLGYTMVHAGIPPMWSVEQAIARAKEVEAVLQSADSDRFFSHMYGNTPSCWSEDLEGFERLRVITNYFTRMRFCDAEGTLELETKTDIAPTKFSAWFTLRNNFNNGEKIIFGHWASLLGKTDTNNITGLDTGCVWGGDLTLMRLEDQQKFAITCEKRL